MTVEEVFCGLFDKYGEDFSWYLVPLSQSNGALVKELKREIGEAHVLFHQEVRAAARCASNDDVLYAADGETGKAVYYIFHLTYAKQNRNGFPRYRKFADIHGVKEYIEQEWMKNEY